MYKIWEIAESKIVNLLGNKRPIMVQLDLTNACNLSCIHCYHSNHQNNGAISLDQWKKISSQILEFTNRMNFIPHFVLCGGEPLLSPFLKPMLDLICEKFGESSISILTNGTMIRDRHLRLFEGRKIHFQVSFDGPNAKQHDLVRGVGSFDSSREGVKILIASGYTVSILSILSQRTSTWIREFFIHAKEIGASSQNFTRLISSGSGAELVANGFDQPLFGQELKKAMTDIILQSRISAVPTATDQPLFCLLGKTFGQHGLFGINGIVVDYKGQLKISSRSDYVLGSLVDENLEDLFLKHPTMKAIQNGEIDGCGDCIHYRKCGGDRNAAFASSGSFLAKDPGCWI